MRMQPLGAQARFLHPRGWSYYATLRNKLHWHEGRREPPRSLALPAPEGPAASGPAKPDPPLP